MKLIKINTDHYIIVDDSEIEIGDWTHSMDGIHLWFGRVLKTEPLPKKISHSTQPLEAPVAINGFENYAFISLSEVKELIGEVDVEQYAWDNPVLSRKDVYELFNEVFKDKHIEGAYRIRISASKQVYQFNAKLRELAKQKALEDNKDKKYTGEDILDAWELGAAVGLPLTKDKKEKLFQSLQPKTEWEVEFDENGKLKLV